MTPLRFRAWHIGNGKMFPVTGLHFFEGGELSGISIDTEDGEKQDVPLTYYKVMQSTGLKDRNGKEIYESDICKADKPNSYLDGAYEVAWHESKGQWYYKGQPSYKPLYQVGCAGNLRCEVIGNVYENPDLLPQAA